MFEVADAGFVDGGKADWFAEAEFVEVVDAFFEDFGVVAFVGDEDDGFLGFAQNVGGGEVVGGEFVGGICDEKNDVGFFDGGVGLGLDIGFDVFEIADLEAAGIDEEGVVVLDFEMVADAVAGCAGFVGNNGVALAD